MVDKGRTRARTIWNAPRVHKCKKKKNQRNPIKWKWSKNTFFFMIIILKYTTATSERHSHQRTWHQKKVHERNKYKKINDDFSWRSKTVDKSYFLNQNEFHRFVTNGGFFSPFFLLFAIHTYLHGMWFRFDIFWLTFISFRLCISPFNSFPLLGSLYFGTQQKSCV